MSSKSSVLVTIALIAVAVLIGFRYFVHNAYKAFPSGPTFDPKIAPYSDWKEFKAPTGKFSVKLPLVPQQPSQTFTESNDKAIALLRYVRLAGTGRDKLCGQRNYSSG